MPRTRVKICGITRVEDAATVVSAGADAIGLNFYPGSPRFITAEVAKAIIEVVPAMVTVVGLFVNADADEVRRLCAELELDVLQFHGDEDNAFCDSFGRSWMKAIRVADSTDVKAEIGRFPGASALLLDAYRRGVPGGTGEVFDWDKVPAGTGRPLVLAGGLNSGNVALAIDTVKPFAVDVSGGVESEPGIKDAAQVAEFVEAVQGADWRRLADENV